MTDSSLQSLWSSSLARMELMMMHEDSGSLELDGIFLSMLGCRTGTGETRILVGRMQVYIL